MYCSIVKSLSLSFCWKLRIVYFQHFAHGKTRSVCFLLYTCGLPHYSWMLHQLLNAHSFTPVLSSRQLPEDRRQRKRNGNVDNWSNNILFSLAGVVFYREHPEETIWQMFGFFSGIILPEKPIQWCWVIFRHLLENRWKARPWDSIKTHGICE